MNNPNEGTKGIMNLIVSSLSSYTWAHIGLVILSELMALKIIPRTMGTKSHDIPNTIIKTITEIPKNIRLDNLIF